MKEIATKLALAAMTYFTPLVEIFILMMVFVAADLVSGIIASSKRNVPRSSRRGRKSVTKVLCYLAVVMLSYVAEQTFDIEWFVAHRAIAAFICVVEFISILENFAVITGRPVFLKIIKMVRGKASHGGRLIDEILSEKNENKNQ